MSGRVEARCYYANGAWWPIEEDEPVSGRDANQLAAEDLRDRFAVAALDELVGLVGTLQQERDDWKDKAEFAGVPAWQKLWDRTVAAEAALATTRQALTDISDSGPRWATVHRSDLEYVIYLQGIARRALAATDGTEHEPARVGYICAHDHAWWMPPTVAPKGCPVCNTITFALTGDVT